MATRVVVPLLQQEHLKGLAIALRGQALTHQRTVKEELAWVKMSLALATP